VTSRECYCRIHAPRADQEATFDDGDRKVMVDVAEHGWHIVMILDSPRAPGWLFTVGMWHTLGSPELALFGLPHDRASLLNDIGRAVRGGTKVDPSQPLEGFLTSELPLAVRPADVSWYQLLFGYAVWFAQAPPLPIVQIVWPDPEGRFLWDDGIDEDYSNGQPRLWIPADEHPMGAWSGLLAPDVWPFSDPEDARVITTKRIALGGGAILHAFHEPDGQWQFTDDGTLERADIEFIHLVHAIGFDASLVELADLPRGWMASRQSPTDSWHRMTMEDHKKRD
jgi:hypothetical protein